MIDAMKGMLEYEIQYIVPDKYDIFGVDFRSL